MRKVPLVKNEFYHVYNRGVDKRLIFNDQVDINRFLKSMEAFNVKDPVGSLYELSFQTNKQLGRPTSKLVEIVSFCLNPNHFHILLKQVSENGISEFMKRLLGGYTKYFNERNKRTGSLFGGRFKSAHVSSNEYILHLSVYINLNYQVHGLNGILKKLHFSSWEEYMGNKNTKKVCKKAIILDQFRNRKEYKKFAEEVLPQILDRKRQDQEAEEIYID